MTTAHPQTPNASLAKRAAAFLILLALYQAAEGIGGRLLHNDLVANLFMLSSVAAAPLVSRWLGWNWLGAYALDLKRGAGLIVLCGLVAAATAKALALAAGVHLGVYAVGAPSPHADIAATAIAILAAMLITAVPSIAEDIITRGFWLRGAAIKWSGAAFILASSAIYLFNHVWRLGEGPIEWLRIFTFGLAYAAAAWRWRTLWAAFGLHWGWNLSNALLDQFVQISAASTQQSALISAGAHLMLTVLVLAWPNTESRRQGT